MTDRDSLLPSHSSGDDDVVEGGKESPPPTLPAHLSVAGDGRKSVLDSKNRYERFRIQSPDQLAANEEQQPPVLRRRRWLKTCYDTFNSDRSMPPNTPPVSPRKESPTHSYQNSC